MVAPNANPISSLYVHVPFCAKKCEYCAFFSEASNGDVVNRYVEALVAEIGMVATDLSPRTIFFGGGTPTLLNLRQWERVLEAMRSSNLTGAEEWTVEANPATVSLDKARLLRSAGVNRISMGVQSLDEALLDRLGRVHSREMVFKSFDILRQAGFENINLDLMFAIPGQTLELWRKTLDEAIAMGSEHLSCYEVIYEEDTALYEQLQAGEFEVDEDLACDMYEELVRRACDAGFRQYEVANFGRMFAPENNFDVSREFIPERACKHNVNYWRGGSFYGLGPSATGYVRGIRTRNWANTQMYCDQVLDRNKRAIESTENLPSLNRAGETAAFGLRMNAGWPFDEFLQVTGQDLRGPWAEDMANLAERGWGRILPDRFQLTSDGLRFADAAAELFLR